MKCPIRNDIRIQQQINSWQQTTVCAANVLAKCENSVKEVAANLSLRSAFFFARTRSIFALFPQPNFRYELIFSNDSITVEPSRSLSLSLCLSVSL